MSQPEREFTEEELRAIEAEMEKLTVDDVLLQTLVTLINLGARKAGLAEPPGEEAPKRDLEQTRQAIDGARALLPLLEARHGDAARPGQGRAVAAPDGVRAAFRRNAAAQPDGSRNRTIRARPSRPGGSGFPGSSRAVDSRRSYGGPLRAAVSLCLSPARFPWILSCLTTAC